MSKPKTSSAQSGPEAAALMSRLAAIQADAGVTIAMRLPILAGAAFGGRGQREASKAVNEKIAAVMEMQVAAGQAAALFWWDLAFSPLTQLQPAEAFAKAATSTLEPISRRTRANAARLSRR